MEEVWTELLLAQVMCKNQKNKLLLLRCKNVWRRGRKIRGLIKNVRIKDCSWTKLSEQILCYGCTVLPKICVCLPTWIFMPLERKSRPWRLVLANSLPSTPSKQISFLKSPWLIKGTNIKVKKEWVEMVWVGSK